MHDFLLSPLRELTYNLSMLVVIGVLLIILFCFRKKIIMFVGRHSLIRKLIYIILIIFIIFISLFVFFSLRGKIVIGYHDNPEFCLFNSDCRWQRASCSDCRCPQPINVFNAIQLTCPTLSSCFSDCPYILSCEKMKCIKKYYFEP